MSNLPAIEIQNLDHSFDKTSVLEKVSFRVEQGEFIGIFGPNGGGKTTLLRLLMGFQKPSRGQIRLFGKSPENLRPKIGYVPQINRLDKLFPITVLDIVLMGCLSSANIFGRLPSSTKVQAQQALQKVGLEDKKDCSFGSLSGGQAQRVLIARAIVAQPDLLFLDEPTARNSRSGWATIALAIVAQPDLLFLDEPTASVDPEAEKDILKILEELKGKTTILMVTHDLQTIINQVGKLLCVHKQVHTILPNQVCEHFGLGLYHRPISQTTSIGGHL